MNNIGKMVKQYNQFIDDIGLMNKDISEMLINEFKLEYAAEYWSPRDRSAWSSKQRFNSWYKNKKIILYVCIDLITDIPYLQILKCDVNLKNAKIENFTEYDGFAYTDDTSIEKIEEHECIYSFQQDWGEYYYCKIDISSVSSNEIIYNDIKNVVNCFLKNDFKELDIKNIVLMKN
jgi:hypothetical protein